MESKYYHSKESVTEYINMAKDVNSAQLIEKLKKHLEGQALLLELGSGPGTDWQILNKHYKTTGSDNSIEFLKHLKENNPEGSFLNLDAVTLETDSKYKGIYSNKVLHHLSDNELKKSIKRQVQVLTQNGIVCHSFWKGEGSEMFKGMFVNYHTHKNLEAFFEPLFKILLIEEYTEFESNDSLVLIAELKE